MEAIVSRHCAFVEAINCIAWGEMPPIRSALPATKTFVGGSADL